LGSFADRIRALIGEGSANAFARECAIGESSVRQYLAGGVPGLDKVIQIARAKNVRVEWLATGEGPQAVASAQQNLLEDARREEIGGDFTPSREVLGLAEGMVLLHPLQVDVHSSAEYASTGDGGEVSMAFRKELLQEISVDPRHARIFRVAGNSMYPTLHNRDVVILDASVTTLRDEGLYTLVIGDRVRAKRLQPLAAGGIRISSDNKAEGFADEFVPLADRGNLRIVGRIRGLLRWFPEDRVD